MKFLPVLLLLAAGAVHAQTATVNFGAAVSCTGSTTTSLCSQFTTDNPAYAVDSIIRTNNGKLTINVNNMAYSAQAGFITDQVIQQQCCGHDGLVLEHIESLDMISRLGTHLYLTLKVEQDQHGGGGPGIKQHYTQNTYGVQSGTIVFP